MNTVNHSPRFLHLLGVAAACVTSLSAAVIIPSFETFGTLDGATFGGTGIPNTDVAISTYDVPAVSIGKLVIRPAFTITLGLTAHGRYENPATTNDGAGTYFANAGGDTYSSFPDPTLARWNLGAFIDFEDRLPPEFSVAFLYDTDPAVGNDVSTFLPIIPVLGIPQPYESSSNLGFLFPYGVLPTNGVPFDPEAEGEYSFALGLFKNSLTQGSTLVAHTAINVNVVDYRQRVPEGGMTLALLAPGMVALAAFRHRFNRANPRHGA